MTKRTKRMLLGVATLTLLVVIAFLSLPWWLPWIARPIAGAFGAGFGGYERMGYSRFVLRDAYYADRYVRFQVQRIEAATPNALLWNAVVGGNSVVKAEDWSLTVFEDVPSDPGRTNTITLPVIVARVEIIIEEFCRWFPRTALTNGAVVVEGQTIQVPWLVAQGRDINTRAAVKLPKLGEVPVEIQLNRGAAGTASALIVAPTLQWRSRIVALRSATEWTLSSTNEWRTNLFVAGMGFRDALGPDWAAISAPAWRFSGTNRVFGAYGDVSGALAGVWTNRAFDLRLTFGGTSIEADFPPVTGALVARGDTNEAVLHELHVESPAVRIDLSSPLRFSYSGELLSGPARLGLKGDLSRLPMAGGHGEVQGTMEVQPLDGNYPQTSVQLALTNFGVRGIELRSGTLKALLRWPLLRVEEVQASLVSGAQVQGGFVANTTNRVLTSATLQWTGRLPTNVIPAAVQYSNLTLTAEAQGPMTNLTHRATATITDLNVPGLAPVDLELRERGRHFRIDDFRALASANEAALEIGGSGEWNGADTDASVTLAALNFWRAGAANLRENFARRAPMAPAPVYSLAEPATFRLGFQTEPGPRIQLSPLRWQGAGRSVGVNGAISWPVSADLRITAEGLRMSDFTNCLATPLAVEVLVTNLQAMAGWTNGPVIFALNGTAEISAGAAPPVRMTVISTNTAGELRLSTIELTMGGPRSDSLVGTLPLLTGDAILPIGASGTSTGFTWRVRADAPARLELRTSTNAALPGLLAEYVRASVAEPALHVALDGTLKKPQGTVHLSARSVMPHALTNEALPELRDLRANVTFDSDAIRLHELRATVAGQPILGTAEIPLADSVDWRSRLRLDRATADVRVSAAELAAFAAFATNLLAPRGTLDVNVALRPGMQLSGHVRMTNAATAVFPTIGAIQDIDVQVRLQNERVAIESLDAHLGGALVTVNGGMNFAGWRPALNRWPDINLRIAGTNVALVRESKTILRTDLDLVVTNAGTARPAVGGKLALRDSLFLSELMDLVPRGVTKPSQRPPYFSVDAPFVRDWPLDIQVTGDRFLTVRTPFFRGEISASLNVRGNLLEPRAVGDLRLAAGRINFPFATLTVQQGFVTLGSADPYHPQLFVTAAGNAFDYDIRLEITGTAQKPVLEMSSIPPLTSEQILLMVTSGQIPRSDYTLSTEQRAQRLGMFVGKNLLSQFGVGGTAEKLTIRSGENVSESGRETYAVEYKLTDRVSLVGEYDRFDEYNAGIQWRVFSK